ncbi:37S ribosomal protein S23, mitochondrial [[Candida] anglica]|uniref:Small ribosomal subunit protein mS29 n=1 Tax=[Candida] anglica TaxID=148631 RepID=A0ABP0EGG3_9ASCO
MLRFAFNRVASANMSVKSCADLAARRSFSSSMVVPAAAPAKPVKKKIRQGYTRNTNASGKAKKGGMTDMKFRDAVRGLGYEKYAPSLSNLHLETLNEKAVGTNKVTKFSSKSLAKLVSLETFKKFQHVEMFSEPVSLVTQNTHNIHANFLSKLNDAKSPRLCLLGEKGSGKSTLIAQTMALALEQHNHNIVLLHIDHPEQIVNGTSDYIFNSKTKQYQQPMFTKRWIEKVRDANKDVFQQLKLSRDVSFVTDKKEHQLKKDENTVYDFVANNADFAKQGSSGALQFLIEELQHHSKTTPVLVSIDNFTGLINDPVSKYRHPDFTPIHFTDFEMGSFALKVANGEIEFAKGGVLLSSSSDNRNAHTLNVALGLEQYDPYYKNEQCDVEVVEALLKNGGIANYSLTNLSKDQARELLTFWESAGVLQLRDYVRKEKKFQMSELASQSNVPQVHVEAEELFEKTVQNYFTLSSGNVGGLVKAANFLY